MSDFETRDEHERRLKAALLLAFTRNLPIGGIPTEDEYISLQSDLETALVEPLNGTIDATIDQTIDDYDIRPSLEEIKKSLSINVEQKARQLAKEITDNTRAAFADESDIEGVVDTVYGETRAGVIAATETTAANVETVVAIGQAGFFDGVLRWKTEEDETVCEECEPKNDKLISVVGQPPEHPNCRCWVE